MAGETKESGLDEFVAAREQLAKLIGELRSESARILELSLIHIWMCIRDRYLAAMSGPVEVGYTASSGRLAPRPIAVTSARCR